MDFAKIRREYRQQTMEIESLDPNPMQEFQKWIDEAHRYYGDECNAMTLATANSKGAPAARTVLLKGVTREGFLFYSNYLSRKGRDLSENPQAALLFYWPLLDRQIRIEGPVSKVAADWSDSYFYSRPVGSQISAIVSPQSQRISLQELIDKRTELEKSGDIKRPDHWGGYEVKGMYFEFWNGKENRFHDRFVYQKMPDGRYERYRLAP